MNLLRKSFFYFFLLHLASIVFSIAAAQIIYAILFIIWLVILIKEKQFSFTSYDFLFLAFVVIRIFSILISEYPEASSLSYYREIIFYPYYFIAKYFVQQYELAGIKQSITVMIYSLIIPAVYAVVTVVNGQVERGSSFSGGYSMFAVHCAFIFAFTLVFMLVGQNEKRKIMSLSLLTLFFAAIISTFTRSIWISVLFCLVVVGFIGNKKYFFYAIVAIGLLVVSVHSIRERFTSMLAPMQNSSGRLELWNTVLELIPKHLIFGFGPETFDSIVGDKTRFPDPLVSSWHNEFLQTQIESGIVATIILLLIYGSIGWIIVRLYKHLDTDEGKFMFLFSILSFAVIIPSIMFGSIMFSILNEMILKFTFVCISYFAQQKSILKQYKWGWL
jgi:O-antigen ligase